MLWLQRTPLLKLVAVGLVVSIALWLEVRPDPMVDYPFATAAIAPGDPIDAGNTEMRRVPDGLLEGPTPGDVALTAIPAGTPVLGSDTASADRVTPDGWWALSVDVPLGAAVGDLVRVVLLDTGSVVDGMVSSVSSADPFGEETGAIAVAGDDSAEVAVAAANGRLAVLVSTKHGGR